MFRVSRKPVGRSHISAAFIRWGAVSWESVQFPFRTEAFCALTTHVDTKTRAGMHADMNTCLCVRIHRGVNESPQRKGKRANVSPMSAGIVGDDFYVVSYWKLLGVKPLTVLARKRQIMNVQMHWCDWCKVTATRLKWLFCIRKFGHWSPSRISGRARAVPLFRPGTAKLHWRAVHCQGEEPDLLQCPKTTWNGGECSLVAAITCNQQQGIGTPHGESEVCYRWI